MMLREEQTMNSVEDVMDVERRWTAAHRNGDFATLEQLMADDYVRILPDGSLTGKAGVLAALVDEGRAWDFAAGDEYDVRLLGDTAVVVGRWRARGVSGGAPFDYAARFLSVYVRRDGRWLMLAEQSTAITSADGGEQT
jgi:uncharacterized protein (TIGR02246 family)